jgi:hypothetical protein
MGIPRWAARAREPLLAGLGALALALALTWPAALRPGEAALGHVHADGMKHLWTLWWMRASVWDEGALPFSTGLINHPLGMDLYPIEPLNGLVAVLLPWLSIVALSNLLIVLNLSATGLAGYGWGRLLSGSPWGGVVAGLLLEGSAVMSFFVHVGVGELTHLWWLPLGFACLHEARRTLRWGWFFALSGCLVGAMLSGFYLGFFLAMGVALWALLTLWAGRQTPALLLRYAVAAGLAIAVVYPVTQTFSSSYKAGTVPPVGLQAYLFEEHGQPVTDPASARLELAHLVAHGREPARREEAAYGGGRYLGVLPLLLALGGVVRQPRRALPWAAVGGLGLLFALGSFYTAGGEAVLVNGARLRMPLIWLNRLLGYVAEPLNFPVRFLALSSCAVAALGALAWRRDRPSGAQRLALPALALAGVIEVTSGELGGWPWATFAPRPVAGLEALRAEPGAVIDLGLALRADHENRWNALSAQIVHGQPTHAVPIERIESFERGGYRFVRALKLIQDLQPVYENVSGAALGGDYRADLAVARAAGFRWVLVVYRSGAEQLPRGLVRELDALLGPACVTGPGLAAWALPEVAATADELAAWQAAHDEAVKQVALRDRAGQAPPLR